MSVIRVHIPAGSDGACVNSEGTYTCNCEPGFQWSTQKMKCRGDTVKVRSESLLGGGGGGGGPVSLVFPCLSILAIPVPLKIKKHSFCSRVARFIFSYLFSCSQLFHAHVS